MIIDDHNSIELKALNKTIKHLETVLKKEGFPCMESKVELKTIKGKYYIDTIKLEVIPLKTEWL